MTIQCNDWECVFNREGIKSINDNDVTLKTNSLCWECARACGGANCPWADDLKPVRGWILAPDIKMVTKGVTVLYCPMFFKGRNRSVMSVEDIETISTNTGKEQICRPLIRYNEQVRTRMYECPKCGHVHDVLKLRCDNCDINFLADKSSNYAVSWSKLLLRQQLIRENSHDFPNSKYSNKD